ncbi:hypothetical protein TNIN_6631 [Trichonephila inaurata madagascariensis]|uniref:Uncharacterized protein n=1 Tax=Trichonephila inaurata madagascariensis TaxID=2747483 RepID=A0A8X6JKC3_9ARAC|nr:hypothetical protein TNIN_6631 [Trichonephila inaurata madagascariensis]
MRARKDGAVEREARPTFPYVSRKVIERVSECPTHILDLVRSPCACRLKQSKCELKRWKANIRRAEGGKTIIFLLVSFPREIRGSNEGSEGRSCCAEARPTFPDVRGQVEDIILGNRETQTSLWSSHTARNRSDFNIRHQQLTSTTFSDRAYALSVSRKGIERVSECPTHILDLVRSLSVQVKAPKGPMRGLADGAVGAEARPTFPDVRGSG